ncbi:hypothetical protein FJTKL_01479 [Diaporthe vaccinii]|uniref:Uncharacterized protein n=1 Tax=Diaporthe vaccinii TaxID=105482 RepID=A0ABR4E0K9_9PEZI
MGIAHPTAHPQHLCRPELRSSLLRRGKPADGTAHLSSSFIPTSFFHSCGTQYPQIVPLFLPRRQYD